MSVRRAFLQDPVFYDRRQAGRRLAEHLQHYAGDPDVVVLGLPRGGVPVAAEVARALGAPLDVFAVRKLGVPGHEELAMGAMASGGVVVLEEKVVRDLHIGPQAIKRVAAREIAELERREAAYRDGRPAPDLAGKTVILIDDGLATGSTMRAAVRALRGAKPKRIVVGVPVGPSDTCRALAKEADEVVCAVTPPRFRAVGLHYVNFDQTSDDEVRRILRGD